MMPPFQKATQIHSSIELPRKEDLQSEKGEQQQEGSTQLRTTPVVLYDDKTRTTGTQHPKKVTFDSRVAVRTHLHIDDMTESERKTTWYHEDDFATIRAQCCEIIQRIMHENKILRKQGTDREESILSCNCRGLEYITKAGSKLRFEHRLTAWDVVDLEQNRQWNEGTSDEDRIAEAYHACADESSRVAYRLALRDQQWVQDHKFDTPLLDRSYYVPGTHDQPLVVPRTSMCCISVSSTKNNTIGLSPGKKVEKQQQQQQPSSGESVPSRAGVCSRAGDSSTSSSSDAGTTTTSRRTK